MVKNYEKDIEELVKAVGKKAKKNEIESEFRKYVEDFKIPVQETKRSLARKFDVSLGDLSFEGEEKTLAEIMAGENNVSILCRVVYAEKREVTAKGEQKEIYSGILGDNTGTMPFTIWDVGDLELEKGEVLRIEGAYTTEFRDEPQINVGERGVIKKEDKDALPPRSEGSDGYAGPVTTATISELSEGKRNFIVTGRILTKEEREVTVKGEQKDVTSGTIADATGKISYTCWGKTKMKRGEVVEVNRGYLRYWRGMPQLNFDAENMAKSKEKMPDEEELARPSQVTIEAIMKSGGMLEASVSGIILDVRDGSGLIFRCPECNRMVRKNLCKIHGEVEGEPDLRVKAVLDDGSGAMNVVMNRELTERLLKKSLDDCLSEAHKVMDHGVVRDELLEMLVARPMEVIGNVTSDDFGLMMISTSVDFLKVDVEDEARSLLEEL